MIMYKLRGDGGPMMHILTLELTGYKVIFTIPTFTK